MTVPIEEFFRRLDESRLMPETETRRYREAIPEEGATATGEEMAQKLVQEGKLTQYQAQRLLAGDTRALVLGDGAYIIQDKIGNGTAGTVYKAKQVNVGRNVAIKILVAKGTDITRNKTELMDEAKIASKLNHPNVVLVHDARIEEDADYLVFEYVDGRDLATTGACPDFCVSRAGYVICR